ncbi:MAG: methyltransferase, TIGR04325 family [Flavihumibacter sp.]|nr:methyltransferase, TIGR04325 family [Flavihumibacter sp.]
MNLAPIILITYNRPHFTKRTLQTLSENKEAASSQLFVFSDGPKEKAPAELVEKIDEVRRLVTSKNWCGKTTLITSVTNKGLAQSVIEGVSTIMNEYGRAIVIEDDVELSPYFLQFMNEALDKYQDNEKVLSIGSWNYYYHTGSTTTFFTHLPDTIAWATWKRAWNLFEPDSNKLYQQLQQQNKIHLFNVNDRFNYEQMLQQQIDGKVSSWAIRWTGTAVLNNTLTLYPSQSLSKHIGFGSDSTHVKSADYNKDLLLAKEPVVIDTIPVLENFDAVNAWIDFEENIRPVKTSVKKKIKQLILQPLQALKQQRILRRFKNLFKKPKYGWSGSYASWQEAKSYCTGYDAQPIIDKVRAAAVKVKNGEAAYERDGVLFDKIYYSWPLLSHLLLAAHQNNGKLSVLDFGGSLGTSYFQNRHYLQQLQNAQWSVVEQQHYVTIGKNEIAGNGLNFFYTPQEAIEQRGPHNVLLINCVLPYIEKPYELLQQLKQHNFDTIIIESTYFNYQPFDRICIQKVPPAVYDASYPCWLLNYQKIKDQFTDVYAIAAEYETGIYIYVDGEKVNYKSLVLKRK